MYILEEEKIRRNKFTAHQRFDLSATRNAASATVRACCTNHCINCSQSSSLALPHFYTFAGYYAFLCHYCAQIFGRWNIYNRHIRIYDASAAQYQCLLCSYETMERIIVSATSQVEICVFDVLALQIIRKRNTYSRDPISEVEQWQNTAYTIEK